MYASTAIRQIVSDLQRNYSAYQEKHGVVSRKYRTEIYRPFYDQAYVYFEFVKEYCRSISSLLHLNEAMAAHGNKQSDIFLERFLYSLDNDHQAWECALFHLVDFENELLSHYISKLELIRNMTNYSLKNLEQIIEANWNDECHLPEDESPKLIRVAKRGMFNYFETAHYNHSWQSWMIGEEPIPNDLQILEWTCLSEAV